MKDIVVLGATGSIGKQTLDILKYSYDYNLVGITFFSSVEEIEPYLFYFPNLKYVGIVDKNAANEFEKNHSNYKIISGSDASEKLLELNKGATVVNSILGNAGLFPTLKALSLNQTLLLSNKESLVVGSTLVSAAIKNSKSKIYPIDSEHVALNKLLNELKEKKISQDKVKSYIITASGGALYGLSKKELNRVKAEQVLHHPTWAMGKKITIDSATLINKAYEVIEASVLFDIPLEKIKPLICRSSLIHAALDLDDNSRLVELSPVDMKVSIAFALSNGLTKAHKINIDEKKKLENISLEEIDYSFYPCYELTLNMYKEFGNVGMIYFNILDTMLIESFLNNKIPFTDIYNGLNYLYQNFSIKEKLTTSNIHMISSDAFDLAKDIVTNKKYLS